MASRTIIGIDEHIVNCNYSGIGEKTGEIIGTGRFETSATNLINAVNKFPAPRIVVIEQGPLAEWTGRVLEKYVGEVVVADTKRNSWIARDPLKNDDIDGEKLALLYIGGYIKKIIPRSTEKQEFIALVIHYHSLVKESTRLKNKVGAKFRQCGKRKIGERSYGEEIIERDMGYLGHNKGLQTSVRNYHAQLKMVEEQKERVTRRLQKLSRNYPEVAFLDGLPGIGFVGSVTLSAFIDVPERFATVKKLWIYCGYGLDCQSSGGFGWHRITKRGNRYLKRVIGTATHNIIYQGKKKNIYKVWYDENIKKGKNPRKLKANLARKLIKDVWLGWIKLNEPAIRQAA
jgi:transposase